MANNEAAEDFEMGTGIVLHMSSVGQPSVADEIVAAARRNSIPLREDRPLVSALANFNVSGSIPPELFRTAAELLIFLQRIESGT